jgi:hypothetical protein
MQATTESTVAPIAKLIPTAGMNPSPGVWLPSIMAFQTSGWKSDLLQSLSGLGCMGVNELWFQLLFVGIGVNRKEPMEC